LKVDISRSCDQVGIQCTAVQEGANSGGVEALHKMGRTRGASTELKAARKRKGGGIDLGGEVGAPALSPHTGCTNREGPKDSRRQNLGKELQLSRCISGPHISRATARSAKQDDLPGSQKKGGDLGGLPLRVLRCQFFWPQGKRQKEKNTTPYRAGVHKKRG